MMEPESAKGAVIVASEPLSEDDGWEPVPPNNLVLVHEDLQVELRELET
jgi:predicted glutamine amidotransferase